MSLDLGESGLNLCAGFNETIGLSFDVVGPDLVVLSVDISERHLQPFGIVHGGVWCALVETAGSIGGRIWYGERGRVVGVANQTDFLHSSSGGIAVATAEPIHRGRMQQIWSVEVTDQRSVLLARGQVRLQNLPHGVW
jgi:1,4-dihydroxy-2-naphthoyl-CoA hydrolase